MVRIRRASRPVNKCPQASVAEESGFLELLDLLVLLEFRDLISQIQMQFSLQASANNLLLSPNFVKTNEGFPSHGKRIVVSVSVY